MSDQQTNRDFISDRLNARMNQFMYQPTNPYPTSGPVENINSVDRLGSITQKRHTIQMNNYITDHPNHKIRNLPEVDLRKPLNFTVLNDESRPIPVSEPGNQNSEQMNARYQKFEPISANRAYPLQGKQYCPIENKPEDTRQHKFQNRSK